MLNKEEIQYNTRALVSAWLDKIKADSLSIELSNDCESESFETDFERCGDRIGELLFINNGKYNLLKLTGNVSGDVKTIGEIDIV